jgi:hypothetical protein
MWSEIKILLRGSEARNQTILIEAIASASLTPEHGTN